MLYRYRNMFLSHSLSHSCLIVCLMACGLRARLGMPLHIWMALCTCVHLSGSFCPNDSKLITCSDDSTVRVWDFVHCHEEKVLRGKLWSCLLLPGVRFCYSAVGLIIADELSGTITALAGIFFWKSVLSRETTATFLFWFLASMGVISSTVCVANFFSKAAC